jgi:hypothetical protein
MSAITDTIKCSKRAIQYFRSSGDFDYYSEKAAAPTPSGSGSGSFEPSSTNWDINVPDTTVSPVFGWILASLVLLAILALVVYILHKQGFFDKKNLSKEEDMEQETEDEQTDLQITGIDFEDEIAKAKINENWREGIRYIFLKALHALNDKGTIVWDHDKTPTEYSYEARLQPFSLLTTLFLRVWYGMYDTNEQDFHNAEQLLNEVISITTEKAQPIEKESDGSQTDVSQRIIQTNQYSIKPAAAEESGKGGES